MELRRALALCCLLVAACGAPRCGESSASVSAPSVSAPGVSARSASEPAPSASPAEASETLLTLSSTTDSCFTVLASRNSALAVAAFRAHKLAGNGPTWAAILQAVVLRHGAQVTELSEPPAGYPGFGAPFSIERAGRTTWYTLDDEAGAAVFCAPDESLRSAVQRDVEAVNADAAALSRAIAESAAFGVE